MAETKTIQKGWRFSPEIVNELAALSLKERRSEQNMVEVLIHDAFQSRLGGEIPQIKDRDCEAGK